MSSQQPAQPTTFPDKTEINRLFTGIDLSRSRYTILNQTDPSDTELKIALVYRTDALRAQRIIERLGYTTKLTDNVVLIIELPTDTDTEGNDNA